MELGHHFSVVSAERRRLDPPVPEQGIFILFFQCRWVRAPARARRTAWLGRCSADWDAGTFKYLLLDVATSPIIKNFPFRPTLVNRKKTCRYFQTTCCLPVIYVYQLIKCKLKAVSHAQRFYALGEIPVGPAAFVS